MSVNEENPAEKPAEDKRKKWMIGVVCLVAVAVSLFALVREIPKTPAQSPSTRGGGSGPGYPGGGAPGGGPGGQRAPGTRGRITTISATAITIQGRDGTPKTFAVTAATKIMVDRKPAAAADLKAGQRARIVSKDEKSADEINIFTLPPGGGRGGPPGGGGPGGGAPGIAKS